MGCDGSLNLDTSDSVSRSFNYVICSSQDIPESVRIDGYKIAMIPDILIFWPIQFVELYGFSNSPCHWGPCFLMTSIVLSVPLHFENVCDLIWLAFHMPIYCVSDNITFAIDKPFRIRNPYDWSIKRSYFLNHFKFRSLSTASPHSVFLLDFCIRCW
jgi:hypothetical protein